MKSEYTIEVHIEQLHERIIYLEKVVKELKYLAQCDGWKFDHIKEKETIERGV
jgi:hypothetical protein